MKRTFLVTIDDKESEWGEYLARDLRTCRELVPCRECKHNHKCYGNIVMTSKGGGEIYCPIDWCSLGAREDPHV